MTAGTNKAETALIVAAYAIEVYKNIRDGLQIYKLERY